MGNWDDSVVAALQRSTGDAETLVTQRTQLTTRFFEGIDRQPLPIGDDTSQTFGALRVMAAIA